VRETATSIGKAPRLGIHTREMQTPSRVDDRNPTPLEEPGTNLSHGSRSGNIVKETTPGGGGFLSIRLSAKLDPWLQAHIDFVEFVRKLPFE